MLKKNGTKSLLKLPENWDSKWGILEINSNDSILDIMRKEGHIVPSVLEIMVLSKKSKFYDIYLSKF